MHYDYVCDVCSHVAVYLGIGWLLHWACTLQFWKLIVSRFSGERGTPWISNAGEADPRNLTSEEFILWTNFGRCFLEQDFIQGRCWERLESMHQWYHKSWDLARHVVFIWTRDDDKSIKIALSRFAMEFLEGREGAWSMEGWWCSTQTLYLGLHGKLI